jgi:hypothetical protein
MVDKAVADFVARGSRLWWARQASNLRPADYESAALTN